jgi:hypothetical protein
LLKLVAHVRKKQIGNRSWNPFNNRDERPSTTRLRTQERAPWPGPSFQVQLWARRYLENTAKCEPQSHSAIRSDSRRLNLPVFN